MIDYMHTIAYNLYMPMEQTIRIFKALSDETRLRILCVLIERECCVCEVMQALEISQTRASRNLKVIYNAGLLRSRRDGRWVLYSIDKEKMKSHLAAIVEVVEKTLENNPVVTKDQKRLKKAQRVGIRCVAHLTNG